MKKFLAYFIPVLLCFGVGISASLAQADSIVNWYPFLNKPALTPPNFVFPVAWSILYICMGISIGHIILLHTPAKWSFIKIFIIQLLLNFTWSIVFFFLQNPLLGFINIIALLFFIVFYEVRTYPVSKLSSLLFIPYILWVAFASYLNFYILIYN